MKTEIIKLLDRIDCGTAVTINTFLAFEQPDIDSKEVDDTLNKLERAGVLTRHQMNSEVIYCLPEGKQ